MHKVITRNFELGIYSKGDLEANKLAIVCPGLLDPKSYPHMVSHVDLLAQQGYFALSFDPPGTWDSSGSIDDFTISNYLKAIDELVEYFENRPTLILGHSLGGTISMLSAIRNTYIEAFAAIMSPSKLTAARAIDEKTSQWKNEGVRIAYRNVDQDLEQKREFKLPYSFVEDARFHDAKDGLSKLTKPKLFISGKTDTAVEPELVKAAFSVSAQPKELYELESGHDYRYHPRLVREINDCLVNFIEKYDL